MDSLLLPDLAATERFGAQLARGLKAGDCVALSGDLGGGKTELARAVIRARLGANTEVPSPTFTLMQHYGGAPPIFHFDLYRIQHADELRELGLQEALAEGICIIEWPEIAASFLPAHTLHLEMSRHDSGAHAVSSPALPGMERANDMDAFVKEAGWGDAAQEPLAGDASTRRYTRLREGARTAMLMDAPPADVDTQPFIAIARHLRAQNYGAPEILSCNRERGFVLAEDLGDALFTRALAAGEDEAALYAAAVDVLIAWQKDAGMQKGGSGLKLADYDEAAYMREVALFADWFLPEALGAERAANLREEYLALWRSAFAQAALPCTLFVHRDYHADNLLWRGGKVGVLDFQDALWGHPAYDLASLLEDARRDVSPTLAIAELERYIAQTGVGAAQFKADYALLAAQRNSKIVGIFVRLARRDGKKHYLHYLPRVWAHLERDLGAHPLLADLKAWTERHIPGELRRAA